MNGQCNIEDTRHTVPADEPISPLLLSRATLTTDHPASSYGLPVLVHDGTAYGPADLPAWAVLSILPLDTTDDPAPEYSFRDMLTGPSADWSERQITGRRALEDATRAAGYPVR